MEKKKIIKKSEAEPEKFGFLADKAREAGAADARIIPADMIVVEERVRLKCRSGCPSCGKYLTCPPHAPDVEEFRKYLRDYHSALLVKFKSPHIWMRVSVPACSVHYLIPGHNLHKRIKPYAS